MEDERHPSAARGLDLGDPILELLKSQLPRLKPGAANAVVLSRRDRLEGRAGRAIGSVKLAIGARRDIAAIVQIRLDRGTRISGAERIREVDHLVPVAA